MKLMTWFIWYQVHIYGRYEAAKHKKEKQLVEGWSTALISADRQTSVNCRLAWFTGKVLRASAELPWRSCNNETNLLRKSVRSSQRNFLCFFIRPLLSQAWWRTPLIASTQQSQDSVVYRAGSSWKSLLFCLDFSFWLSRTH